MQIQIASTGMAVPERMVEAAELAPALGVDAEWIRKVVGVPNRRVAERHEHVELAAAAARQAIGDGPLPDLVITASAGMRQLLPDMSAYVLGALGMHGGQGFHVHSSCLSFLTGVRTASQFLQAGTVDRVLVVSAEITTSSRSFAHPESAALLGDGAAAAMLTRSDQGSELLGFVHKTWPDHAELTTFRGAGTLLHPALQLAEPHDNTFQMNGPLVYKHARRKVELVLRELFEQAGVSREDVHVIVPHQASGRAVRMVSAYGFPRDRVVNIVGDYGNCVAASLPMALHVAATERLKRGDLCLLLGTGAGLSVAGALWRW